MYPKIYEIVTDDNTTTITNDQRIMLLVGCLSLFFRTPAFINMLNQHYDRLLSDLRSYYYGYSERSHSYFFNKKIDLKNLDYENLKNDIADKSKTIFLKDHLKIFNDYVDFKINDGIGIIKTEDDSQFITSDNPVIIRNMYSGQLHDLFDNNNVIHLPVNHKYLLSITPKSEDQLKGSFSRISGDLYNTLIMNHDIERNSEKWIIGNPESIKNHINDQVIYNELTQENLEMVETIQRRSQIMQDFDRFRASQGNEINEAVVERFIEISKMKEMEGDPNVERILGEFRKQGLI